MKPASRQRLNRKLLLSWAVVAVILLFLVQAASGAVTLVYFIADGYPDRVEVEWETASEVDMAGFYILRSTSEQGDYTDASGFIFSVGDSLSGSTYNFVDQNVVENQVYYYKLQIVDNNQASEYYGPVLVFTSQFTLTLSPTGTAGNTATGTVTPGGSNHTLTPTLTSTNKTATVTKTKRITSSIITATTQQLAVTRTPTIQAVTANPILVDEVATATSVPEIPQLVITPRPTTSSVDQVQNDGKTGSPIGWLFVGIGFAGLLAGGGWLIWAIYRQKSIH